MLYNIVLISATHHHESAIDNIYVPSLLNLPPTSHPSHPSRLSQSTRFELPVAYSKPPLKHTLLHVKLDSQWEFALFGYCLKGCFPRRWPVNTGLHRQESLTLAALGNSGLLTSAQVLEPVQWQLSQKEGLPREA